MKGKAVICLAKSTAQAEMIVRNLKDAGFSDSAISVLYADRSGTSEFAHENKTKAPEGATAGASTGGVLGGGLGLLLGVGARRLDRAHHLLVRAILARAHDQARRELASADDQRAIARHARLHYRPAHQPPPTKCTSSSTSPDSTGTSG